MLDAIKDFLNYYTDEVGIECIADGRIASLKREDILPLQSISDSILVNFDDCNEEFSDTKKIIFNEIKITSDIIIFKD